MTYFYQNKMSAVSSTDKIGRYSPFASVFFLSSGGHEKTKLKLTTRARIFVNVVLLVERNCIRRPVLAGVSKSVPLVTTARAVPSDGHRYYSSSATCVIRRLRLFYRLNCTLARASPCSLPGHSRAGYCFFQDIFSCMYLVYMLVAHRKACGLLFQLAKPFGISSQPLPKGERCNFL